MKSDRQWFIRIERQPHRDAVRRLRKAYGRLWEMFPKASTTIESDEKDKKTTKLIQEVKP
jgi:hypothetical protein